MRAEEPCATGCQYTLGRPPRSAAIFARDRANGFDDVSDVLVGHRRVNWKRQASTEDVFCNGEITIAIPVHALIVVHRVQRDAVHGASDAALAQNLDELIAAELEALGADAQDVEMPGVLDPGLGVRGLERIVTAEGAVVGAREFTASARKVVGALALTQAA